MKNLFDEKESRQFIAAHPHLPKEFALRIYTSLLIGKEPSLVLHGGGNTSVKVTVKNILGEGQEVLFVKGSGVDLASIDSQGFVGLDLNPLRKLKILSDLSEEEMENQLQTRKIFSSDPDPSVESLLHAFLPPRYVDHTHADAILALTNQTRGRELVRETLGERVTIVPYIMPGVRLARAVLEQYEQNPKAEAVVVLNHGIFTFGEDAWTAYERMVHYVNRAENYIRLKSKGKTPGSIPTDSLSLKDYSRQVARLCQTIRGACAWRSGDGRLRRLYVEVRRGEEIREASRLREAQDFCRSGVLTPDHVTRTKNEWVYLGRLPEDDKTLKDEITAAVTAYKTSYEKYFSAGVKAKKVERKMLDPCPRVFLVAGVGIAALGFTPKEAAIAADIAEHTLKTKITAQGLGEYQPVSEAHVFDVEYWKLQQKKIARNPPLPLEGQVALVTGAGGAIGLGIADRLLAAGAAVAVADIDESRLQKVHSLLSRQYDPARVGKVVFDVTRYESAEKAFQEVTCRMGGLDILVPNAGIAHVARVEDLDPQKFDQVIAVNLRGVFNVIKASIPIFKRQGTGGNIVVVSSKNVFDPGAAFGAYSASKAGAHQIGKIAALELAEYGVRVNLVNPDAIFGDDAVPSRLWEEVGPERMKARGLDPQGLREYYRQRNLLKVQVTAAHVGNAVVFFASELTPTTGATLPIDGGIPAAFPR